VSYSHIHLFSNVLYQRRCVSPRQPGAVSVVQLALLGECGGIQRRALVASVERYFFEKNVVLSAFCLFFRQGWECVHGCIVRIPIRTRTHTPTPWGTQMWAQGSGRDTRRARRIEMDPRAVLIRIQP